MFPRQAQEIGEIDAILGRWGTDGYRLYSMLSLKILKGCRVQFGLCGLGAINMLCKGHALFETQGFRC